MTKESVALPRLRLQFTLCALVVSGALAGCTTADLVSDVGLEPQSRAFGFDASDPVLPEMVEVVPAAATGQMLAPDTGDAGSFQVASAAVSTTDAAEIVPVAFAAPMPENPAAQALSKPGRVAARSPELDALIERYAEHHEIPVSLLRRVVNRESTFNPAARNGPYWGLMQILPATAQSMGYRGSPEGLLDAETNLIYAGKYLRGAYLVADGDHDLAVRYYSRGYYYDAKRRGMLEETGLRPARKRIPEAVVAQAHMPRPDVLLDAERPGAAFVPAP